MRMPSSFVNVLPAGLRRLIDRGRSYQITFNPERAEAAHVLADLRRFCYADKPTVMRSVSGSVDPLASAVAEGRREVWLRINQYLCLDEIAIAKLKEPPYE